MKLHIKMRKGMSCQNGGIKKLENPVMKFNTKMILLMVQELYLNIK